ncbi:MAG: VOC family protein [Vulcanimicrobiaceae bacterium]
MAGAWAEFELPDGSAFAIGKHENFPWQAGYSIMFAVPDLEAAIELVKQHGGKAKPSGESPVCTMSFGEDCEGNQLVLHRRK